MLHTSWLGIRRLHWLLAGVLLIALALGVASNHGVFESSPPTPQRVAFDPHCDLRAGPCETRLPNGARVSFSVLPRSIPVAKTLEVEVKVAGLAVDDVTLDLNGVNMRMPPNRVRLKASKPGQFDGQAGLMMCSRNAMEWEALVELKTPDHKLIQVPYRFITVSGENP